MSDLTDERGILYPSALPRFHRHPAPDDLSDRIRWIWIPVWNLPPGKTSRQDVLPFPASNLVVEPGGESLVGPTTGASHRELSGSGWAVGALLRPAGIAALHPAPGAIVDSEVPFPAPALHRTVANAMRDGGDAPGRERAVEALTAWVRENLAPPDEGGRLANAMEDLIAADRTLVRVDEVAERLGISTRGVQRIAQRYVGLAPLTIIRRYRLQEAAQRLREEPALSIARVAAELGYSDHAHLSTDFRRVLGFTPRSYRSDPGHERGQPQWDGSADGSVTRARRQ